MNTKYFLTFFISFITGIILLPVFIRFLKILSLNQPIYELAPTDHAKKSKTPTMGGIIILTSVLISSLFFINEFNDQFFIIIFTLLSYACIGFFDDYKKVRKKNNSAALSPKAKFILQIFFAFIIVKLIPSGDFSKIRLIKDFWIDLGWLYYPFALFIIVGTSNAVNLTDGLDGLATFLSIITSTFLLIISINQDNFLISLLLTSLLGAKLAFLWFNWKPAHIFMGDIGSLSIGALFGVIAILLKVELLLIFFGFIFLIETLSVIMQVTYFKITHGKRIFKMTPIHHHFELIGMSEEEIVIKFSIISVLTCIIGLYLYQL